MPKGEIQTLNCPSCGAEQGDQHAKECTGSATAKQIPLGIKRMMNDSTGLKFDHFLELARPLADLPDQTADEDGYWDGWVQLEERLGQAEATELAVFVRERIQHAIVTQKFSEGRRLAAFAGMEDAIVEIDKAWLEDFYKRFQAMNDHQERRAMLKSFVQLQLHGIEQDPRVKELKDIYCLEEIRELYRFKTKVKSLEAFMQAVDWLKRLKINLRVLSPELFSQVHADAVSMVNGTRVTATDAYNKDISEERLRRLIEEYLDLGIFDFEQDEALIDRYTKTQQA